MVGSCGDGIALTLASSRTILDPLCRWETLSTVHLSQQCPRFSSRAPHLPRRPRENLPTKCFHPSQGITVEVSPHTTTLCLRGKVVVFARCPQALSCLQALAAQACQERSVSLFQKCCIPYTKLQSQYQWTFIVVVLHERVQQYWILVEFMCFRAKGVKINRKKMTLSL